MNKNVLVVFSRCSRLLDGLNGEAKHVVSALCELYGSPAATRAEAPVPALAIRHKAAKRSRRQKNLKHGEVTKWVLDAASDWASVAVIAAKLKPIARYETVSSSLATLKRKGLVETRGEPYSYEYRAKGPTQ